MECVVSNEWATGLGLLVLTVCVGLMIISISLLLGIAVRLLVEM